MEHLTKEKFIEEIFDYENEKEWKFKGDKPTIIDFYAEWCQPCKQLSPILEELSKEYSNINIFKINVDEEKELASAFGIQSIPTMLFIPVNDDPSISSGMLSKSQLESIIKNISE